MNEVNTSKPVEQITPEALKAKQAAEEKAKSVQTEADKSGVETRPL